MTVLLLARLVVKQMLGEHCSPYQISKLIYTRFRNKIKSLTADAIVELKGERTVMPVFYTLVWRKNADGWRIIHEHGSNLIIKDSPVHQAK